MERNTSQPPRTYAVCWVCKRRSTNRALFTTDPYAPVMGVAYKCANPVGCGERKQARDAQLTAKREAKREAKWAAEKAAREAESAAEDVAVDWLLRLRELQREGLSFDEANAQAGAEAETTEHNGWAWDAEVSRWAAETPDDRTILWRSPADQPPALSPAEATEAHTATYGRGHGAPSRPEGRRYVFADGGQRYTCVAADRPAVRTAELYAAEVLAMVRDDAAAGVLPDGLTSFGELHSYVDANDYLQEARVPFGTDPGAGEDGCGMINAVCTLVTERLAAEPTVSPWDGVADRSALVSQSELDEILSAQNLRFARAGNIDPSLPGHGDMDRCTEQAPCGDSGCGRCAVWPDDVAECTCPVNRNLQAEHSRGCAAAQPEHGPEWWRRAVAGECSHGGHGWGGETCSDGLSSGSSASC